MRLINVLVYSVIRGVMLAARVAPMRLSFWFAKNLGRAAYYIAPGRRRLALHNLELALGRETTPERRKEIARRSFESLMLSMVEMIHMDSIYKDWEKHFQIEGAEIIDRLAEEGRGFFVFGGHLGGWTSMASVVYRFPQVPGFNMLARPLRNPRMQELFEYVAAKFGGKIITTSGTGRRIEEAAARGELIGLYMDQESRHSQGIFVDFFGRKALTHVVPGYLAWKSDIPLIPYWIPRTRPGHFRAIFKEPLRFELTDDPQENNRIVTQAIASEVERAIREFPEQWLWAHNRWRRRPDGTTDDILGRKRHEEKRARARKKGDYLTSGDVAKKTGEKGG